MSNQVVGAPCMPLSCPYIGMDGPAAERASQVLLPPPLSPALARQKPHREFLQPRRWKGRNPPGARTARLTGSTPGVVRPAAVRASLDVSHPYLSRLTKRVVAPMWNVRKISELFPFGLQVGYVLTPSVPGLGR